MSGGVARIPAFGPEIRDHANAGPRSKGIAGPPGRPGTILESKKIRCERRRSKKMHFGIAESEQAVWSEPPARPEIGLDRAVEGVILQSRPRPLAGGLLTPDVLIGKYILCDRVSRMSGRAARSIGTGCPG